MKTTNFEFRVQPSSFDPTQSANRAVSIASLIELNRAGKFHFKEPGMKWESMDEDQILVVGKADWAVSRLQQLFQEDGIQLVEFGEEHEDLWRIYFEVFTEEESVADVLFVVKKGMCGWFGQATSSLVAHEACEEIMAAMLSAPHEVSECLVHIPGRKAPIGWNGRRFKTQKTMVRPEFYSHDNIAQRRISAEEVSRTRFQRSKRVFQFRRVPYRNNLSKRNLRYTDVLPPLPLFDSYPNWTYAYDEEGRSDQDETTLKPSNVQSHIDDQVHLTIGDAYFSNDETCPAIFSLGSISHRVVLIRDDEQLEFECWTDTDQPLSSKLSKEEVSWFPMKIVSRLSKNPRNPGDLVRFVVDDHGRVLDWQD